MEKNVYESQVTDHINELHFENESLARNHQERQHENQLNTVMIKELPDTIQTSPKFRKEIKNFEDPVKDCKKKRRVKYSSMVFHSKDALKLPEILPSLCARGAYKVLEKQMFKIPKDPLTIQHLDVIKKALLPLPKKFDPPLLRLPSPLNVTSVNIIRVPSPNIISSKVLPKKQSVFSSMNGPIPSPVDDLYKTRSSGIFINVKDDDGSILTNNVSLGYERPYAKETFVKYHYQVFEEKEFEKREYEIGEDEIDEKLFSELFDINEDIKDKNKEIHYEKNIDKKVKVSKFKNNRESNVDGKPSKSHVKKEKSSMQIGDAISVKTGMTSIWVQKFRRESETKKYECVPYVVHRGTLESHSDTNLKYLKNVFFQYGVKLGGGYHQGHKHFSEKSRNHQGIANAIVSYCYSFIKHPIIWSSQNIDDILEIGDKIYLNTLDLLHLHYDNATLRATDFTQVVEIEKRKFFCQISEPLVIGITRSEDNTIFNLWKGLNIFFNNYSCGLIQTMNLEIAVWKNKFFYVFDPTGRTKELKSDPNGSAIIVSFFNIDCVASYFLDYTDIGNWFYMISQINVYETISPDNELITLGSRFRTEYRVLSETKAIINGSFNLTDKCFGVTVDKQALCMCVVALCYTRITPPAAWYQNTINKILILGNQLYIAININADCNELHLPALFTLGPYRTEISITLNVIWGSLLAEKRPKTLELGLCDFFEKNHMALLQYESFTYAIWTQGNYFYLFDVYSRNDMGINSDNGTSCVTIHNSLESLQETLMSNINKNIDSNFSLHAIKVIKMSRGTLEKVIKPIDIETILNSNKIKSRKPISVDVDMSTNAIIKLQKYEEPKESLMEIANDVSSIIDEYIPTLSLLDKDIPKKQKESKVTSLIIYNLESPSLMKLLEEDTIEDYEDWGEIEFFTVGEGEGIEELELKLLEELEKDFLLEMENKRQQELKEKELAPPIATNTPHIKCLPKQLLQPLKIKKPYKHEMLNIDLCGTKYLPDENTLSEELLIETNFVDLPDGSQIICVQKNVLSYEVPSIILSPFVVIMAIVISYKYKILTWNESILTYALEAGNELYKNASVKFEEAAIHKYERISLGSTDFKVTVKFILDSLFQQQTMENIFEKMLLRYNHGIIVNPNYACAVFRKSGLYYLYDPYPCNKVGSGIGNNPNGYSCLMRFINIHQLVSRILFNKNKREIGTEYETTRFIFSIVKVTSVPPIQNELKTEQTGEEEGEEIEDEMGEDLELKSMLSEKPVQTKTMSHDYKLQSRQKWSKINDIIVIQGTKGLTNRNQLNVNFVNDCHFVCLCVMLMLMCCPIYNWTTRQIDIALEIGIYVASKVFDKQMIKHRIISNILIENFFFSVSIHKKEICQHKFGSKNINIIVYELLLKKKYIMMQFPSGTYVIYFDNNKFYLFDPYGFCEPGKADWVKYNEFRSLMTRLKSDDANQNYCNACVYYSVDVTSIIKVPKKYTLGYLVSEYELKCKKKQKIKKCSIKEFYEKEEWSKVDPIPWSRLERKNYHGEYRGQPDAMWNEWDIEFTNDLYSIWGTIHQKSKMFSKTVRGKQTFANCVIALVMMLIYDLSEWNSIIMDSIIMNGNKYFEKSASNYKNENYEFYITDLEPNLIISPYRATVSFKPVVEGTLFLLHSKQFNLYKALMYFFKNTNQKFGIIISTCGNKKQICAFGKLNSHEYFIYDCQTYGPPLFLDKQGSSYVLRMTTFKRLLYCLALTLKKGDFCIYEINITEFKEEKKVLIQEE